MPCNTFLCLAQIPVHCMCIPFIFVHIEISQADFKTTFANASQYFSFHSPMTRYSCHGDHIISKSLTTEGPSGEIRFNAYEPTVDKVKTKDSQHPFPIAVNNFYHPRHVHLISTVKLEEFPNLHQNIYITGCHLKVA